MLIGMSPLRVHRLIGSLRRNRRRLSIVFHCLVVVLIMMMIRSVLVSCEFAVTSAVVCLLTATGD